MTNWMMKIDGMMCQNCVKHVKNAIEALGASAQVELSAGTAAVSAPENITADDLRGAVTEAGYEVVNVQKA